MLASTIFLAVFVVLADASGWQCANRTTTINLLTYNYYTFPNYTSTPLPYYSPQSCNWSLTVPNGTYGYLTAFLNLNPNDVFSISNGPKGNYNHGFGRNNNDVSAVTTATFFVPPGTFTISFTSFGAYNNGSFAFNVFFMVLPSQIDYKISTDSVINLSQFNGSGTQISLPTNRTFTLRTIPSGCNVNNYMFDACQLYKGLNAFDGLLSQFLDGEPFALSGDYTVVCFRNGFVPENTRLLITDMPDLPSGGTWQVSSDCPYISLSAFGISDAYATDFCLDGCDKYVTNVQFFNSSATLDMYTGSISDSFTSLGSITNSDVSDSLPQLITGGEFKTFRVSSGSATITLEESSATTKFTFTYTINALELGTLQVSVNTKPGTDYIATFTQSTFDSSKSFSAIGYGIEFKFLMEPGYNGKGMMAHYRMNPYNSASKGTFLLVLTAVASSIF